MDELAFLKLPLFLPSLPFAELHITGTQMAKLPARETGKALWLWGHLIIITVHRSI